MTKKRRKESPVNAAAQTAADRAPTAAQQDTLRARLDEQRNRRLTPAELRQLFDHIPELRDAINEGYELVFAGLAIQANAVDAERVMRTKHPDSSRDEGASTRKYRKALDKARNKIREAVVEMRTALDDPDPQPDMKAYAAHMRWHVGRDVRQAGCGYCE